jgi:hypothetical protein
MDAEADGVAVRDHRAVGVERDRFRAGGRQPEDGGEQERREHGSRQDGRGDRGPRARSVVRSGT